MATKKHVTIRVDSEVLEALDAWAEVHGMTRTAALERLVMDGMNVSNEGPSEDAETGGKAPEDAERVKTHTEDLRAVCEVLRSSNADLRAEVSRLWSQLATKDEQIRTAQGLADHAQQLHAAEVTRALPATDQKPTLWERLTGRRKA